MPASADFQDLLQRSLSVDDTWRGRATAGQAADLAELPDHLQPALAVLAAQLLARPLRFREAGLRVRELIETVNAEIDTALNTQLNLVLHHVEFQALEASWRGLHFLVRNVDSDPLLKIRLFDISQRELGRTLRKFRGTAWDQSPIFKKVYEEEFGQFGGEPFGLLVGDYYFDTARRTCSCWATLPRSPPRTNRSDTSCHPACRLDAAKVCSRPSRPISPPT